MADEKQYVNLAKTMMGGRPLGIGFSAQFDMPDNVIREEIYAKVEKHLRAKGQTEVKLEDIERFINANGGLERYVRAYINGKYQEYENENPAELQRMQQRELEDRQKGEEERQRQALMQMRQKERDDELKMLAVIKELNDRFLGLAGNQMSRDTLALNASFLDKVPESKLPEFVKYMKEKMGFEIKGRDHGDVELEERDISKEDTLKKLKDEDLKLVIKTDKFKNPDYKLQLEANKKELNERERKASEREQTQKETQQVEEDRDM